MKSLRGRHILILGASDGIGYATAEFLLRTGSTVTVSSRGAAKLEAAAERLRHTIGVEEGQVRVKIADALDLAQVTAAVRYACDERGQLQALLIVAGSGSFRSILENDTSSMAAEFANNVFPVVNAINAAVPVMSTGGAILAISSSAAVQSSPNLSAYGAAKAALEQYVRVAADELGSRNIRVNAVRPGLTKTGSSTLVFSNQAFVDRFVAQTPLGRYATPTDLAAVLGFLLSDEAAWMTGQCVSVDGGWTLRRFPELA